MRTLIFLHDTVTTISRLMSYIKYIYADMCSLYNYYQYRGNKVFSKNSEINASEFLLNLLPYYMHRTVAGSFFSSTWRRQFWSRRRCQYINLSIYLSIYLSIIIGNIIWKQNIEYNIFHIEWNSLEWVKSAADSRRQHMAISFYN